MARRIAVYGGSFNPFANHHGGIIRWIVEKAGYPTVVVVPAASHALKPELPEFGHRYNMAMLGVNHLQRSQASDLLQGAEVWVSQVELNLLARNPGPVRTYEVLVELRKQFGEDAEINFAIGPDIPDELDKWHNVDKIEEEFGFLHVPIQAMRATKLREMIGQGLISWYRHVSLPVRRYIEQHGLYKEAA